ncbi:MAG TPA: chemotaxis protein CheW [Rhodocyclaceae bacterium]|nr:chemotaxis protein CheW [Rhodocyclaceae bacterium]
MTEEVLDQPRTLDDESGEAVSDTRQFVTFLAGGEVFAVDMAPVQEIIRVPDVVRVPLAPPTLDGLSNLRGRVLPIISLRRVFGFDEQEHDDSTRAVVIDIGQPLGFVVDKVASVINVEPAKIEGVAGIRGTVNTELLTGILKDVSGYPMVMVLDFGKLIEQEFAAIAALASSGTATAATADGADTDLDDEANSDELQLVSFSVEEQEYAIDIESVQEIVQVPDNIVHVPNSPSHVLGLMTLRERLLPLVSLRSLFSLPMRELDERSRIVVISLGAAAVGVVTDAVSEVLRVPGNVVDAMPPLLARDGDLSDISQICRLDGGKRMVSIISADNMFRHSVVKDALKSVENMEEDKFDDIDDDAGNDDEEQVVVFQLAAGEFGVPIDSVQEIVRVPDELTHVPKAPDFVEGVINLRGAVLPVIDQRKRLDLPAIERNDRQRIMVFLLAGVRTGFIVDAVAEVLKIPKDAIEASPKLSGEQSRLLGRVANLEKQKRMIQLIEPSHLIDDTDTATLAAISA